MSIAKTIIYISIVFWLLPPFRQFRCKLFYYFLILAIADPTALFFLRVLDYSPHIVHPIAGILLFYSINPSKTTLKKYWVVNVIFIAGFFICFIYFENLLYLTLLMHLLILFKFVQIIIMKIYTNHYVSLFYLALVFYELSAVINLSEFLGSSDFRVVIYYMTLSFQILMAIFFTIFTEKSDFLILKLRSDN